MIGYIKGNVISYNETTVLLENNGIGYEILCSASVQKKLIDQKSGEVYTYLAVREDGISLYGFSTIEEKNMFLKLITVSGVGPKSGIAILSAIDISSLATMIATEDVKGLSKIKGLGKKSAERIIVELRESVNGIGDSSEQLSAIVSAPTPDSENAILALISLGYTKSIAVKAVNDAMQNGASTVEDIIACALRSLV